MTHEELKKKILDEIKKAREDKKILEQQAAERMGKAIPNKLPVCTLTIRF